MNILLSTFERHFSQFAAANGRNQATKLAQMHHLLTLHKSHKNDGRICFNPLLQIVPWHLPAKQKPLVLTFPSPHRKSIRAPGLLVHEVLEKYDPFPAFKMPLKAPHRPSTVEKLTGERMLKIRRHKMRKHKRRKRYDRDYFKYQKYHRQKKAKAEASFRSRMQQMLDEYKAFDPENYIKDTIARAKQDVMKDVSPSGRRKYPHWSTIVTLEELYGLPQTDYIDKKAGLAGEEDRDKIKQLKKEYDETYRGFLTRSSNRFSETKQMSIAGRMDVQKASDEGQEKKNVGNDCQHWDFDETEKAEVDDIDRDFKDDGPR